MNARTIELVGEALDLDTENKHWLKEHKKVEAFESSILKKNALRNLQDVFKKMFEDGIHYIELPFMGGHDEGGFDGDFQFFDKNGEEIKDVKNFRWRKDQQKREKFPYC